MNWWAIVGIVVVSLTLFGSLDRVLAGLREIRAEQAAMNELLKDIAWRQANPNPAPWDEGKAAYERAQAARQAG